MEWSSEAIDQFENIVTKLSGETHLATPGSDDGLLPIFCLVNELSSDLPDDPAIASIIEAMNATLQPLLDEAKPFEDTSIDSLKNATNLLSDALHDLKQPTIEQPASKPSAQQDVGLFLQDLPTSEESDAAYEPDSAFESDEEIEAETASTLLLTTEQSEIFAKLAQQFSGELLLVESGSDEGLLPIYSLIKDFENEFTPIDPISRALNPIASRMDALLDEAGVFDESTIDLLTEFNFWLETARSLLAEGRDILPFEPTIDEVPTHSSTTTTDDSGIDFSTDSSFSEFAEFDVIMDLNLEENQELLIEFHLEAVDHLGQIESAVLDLEQDGSNREAIDSMFRSFHTIKGVAGFLNLIPMNRLAHEIESLMDRVRNDELEVFTGIIDLVLDSKDTIARLIGQISDALSKGSLPQDTIPVSELMTRARWAMDGPDFYNQQLGIASPQSQSTPALGSIDETISSESTAAQAGSDPKISETASPSAKPAAKNATIRVNTWKLDNLMDMVGELVIVRSQLIESSQSHARENSSLQRNLSQLNRITKELQHTSMSLRMVPVKPTFQKMGRVVRDVSAKSGKKVLFEVFGEDTELDRNVVEEIGDPLVHMVRNALDHGLESTEERVLAGKDETGCIALKAYHKGSNIVIELSDDGRGIDADRVLEKAISNGVVRSDESLSKDEIYKLIFAPGFSTAEEITDLSGRGVGMDVVRKNIERLRGRIEISSNIGKGSTFRILLPLTMAIVDGLVVKVGEDRFILPTTSVKVALRPDEDSLAKIQGNEEVLSIRGKVIPLFRLHQHFKIPHAETDPKKATVVIVETSDKPCGLLVDSMISKQEVVIKSLGSLLQGIPGVSGGAILGDGNVALILDPTTLIGAA